MYTHRHTNPDNPDTWIETIGPWDIPVKVRALCADGVLRTARTVQSPDTFFSLPARVTVRGKTVSGYITSENNPLVAYRTIQGALALGYVFIPYQYGKNHAQLPAWLGHDSDPTR